MPLSVLVGGAVVAGGAAVVGTPGWKVGRPVLVCAWIIVGCDSAVEGTEIIEARTTLPPVMTMRARAAAVLAAGGAKISSADARSAAFWKRSSGFLARQRLITSTSGKGMSP